MKKILSSLLITSTLAPTLLFAQSVDGSVTASATVNTPTGRTAVKARAEAGFCAQVDTIVANLDTRNIKLEDRRTEAQQNADQKRDDMRAKVDEARKAHEADRAQNFAKLQAMAKTDKQQQAVATFIATVQAAITTRDQAIDASITKYRSEVDAVTTARRTAQQTAINTLKSSIDAAKAKAQSDCAKGVSGPTVRTAFRTAIENARQTFKSTIMTVEKNKDVAQSDRDARKADIDKANAAFRASVQAATAALKAAFAVQANVQASSTVSQ